MCLCFLYKNVALKATTSACNNGILLRTSSSAQMVDIITKTENITKDIIGSYGYNPQTKFLYDVSMNRLTPFSEKSIQKFRPVH